MPSTHCFVPIVPLEPLLLPELPDELLELVDPLEPEELPELVEPDELLELVEPLDPDELDEPPPQNVGFARLQAFSFVAQAPSTQAAARYDSPSPQLQHEGLQSAYVEHAKPDGNEPLSFCGLEGHEPLVCSACEEMFELSEGSVPSTLPPSPANPFPTPVLLPLHAASMTAVARPEQAMMERSACMMFSLESASAPSQGAYQRVTARVMRAHSALFAADRRRVPAREGARTGRRNGAWRKRMPARRAE